MTDSRSSGSLRYSRNRATRSPRDLSSRPTTNLGRIAFDLEFRIWGFLLDVRCFFHPRRKKCARSATKVGEAYESSIVVLTERWEMRVFLESDAPSGCEFEKYVSRAVRYWSTAVGGKVSKILCRFSAWCLREISSRVRRCTLKRFERGASWLTLKTNWMSFLQINGGMHLCMRFVSFFSH